MRPRTVAIAGAFAVVVAAVSVAPDAQKRLDAANVLSGAREDEKAAGRT